MGVAELLLLAIGLSMDAFAVSVTNGLCMRKSAWKTALSCGLCFGLFQGAMPSIGFALGRTFTEYVTSIDHYIALVLLAFIGGKMLIDAFKDVDESCDLSPALGLLLVQGVATSIDALAVGVSFAALSVNIVYAASFICCVTFLFSFVGVFIGNRFGTILNSKAQILGGLILIGIGLKIFIEHMFFS
ncbi:MAG: manganese efflux pump MntP family protein [Ruminococcus sp.]|nr:manganese efflux pump MntP family protein [Ruminococcus sp.]